MNFNWKEKMFLIILLCVLFTALGASFYPKTTEKCKFFHLMTGEVKKKKS